MIRFLYEIFFELAICAMINFSDQKAAGIAPWALSVAIIFAIIVALLAVMSLFCKNGPYIRDTYAQGSLLSSFWGSRALHEEVLNAALAHEDKTTSLTKRESLTENAAVANATDSNTQTMFNSNVPLN